MATTETGQLTEKEQLKLRLQRLQRQYYMEYLLKQVAEVTYQYNCFQDSSLLEFVTVRPRQIVTRVECRSFVCITNFMKK